VPLGKALLDAGHDVVRTRRDAAVGEEDPGADGAAPDLAGSMPGDLVAAVLERALQAELTTYLEYDRAAYCLALASLKPGGALCFHPRHCRPVRLTVTSAESVRGRGSRRRVA